MKEKWQEVLIELVKDFVSVRSAITLGAFGLTYYLFYIGKEIPPMLSTIIDLLLGFWFGQKVGQAMAKTNGAAK